MKNLSKKILVVVLMLCFLIPQGVIAEGYDGQDEGIDTEYYRSIIEMIKGMYNGEVNEQHLIEGALKGMFGTMDKYTTFYTPSEAEKFFGDVGGQYEGIGVSMGQEGDYIVILKVFPGSPAEKAGLSAGDRIASVDDRSVVGMAPEDAAPLIKGPAGTKVTLGVIKVGEKKIINIDVVRASIKINPVTYEIRNGIGYIKIDTFNSNTYEYMLEAMSFMDNNKIEKIILDLRDNPGGEVNQAAAVAGFFVPEGRITKLDFKSPYYTDIEYVSELKSLKYKLAVLVNEGTASASEILAGAVQDTGAGVLVGTNTFGKAKVQSLIPILTPEAYSKYKKMLGMEIVNGYDLIYNYGITLSKDEVIGWTKITTGIYLTPKDRMIDGVGLTPDVTVERPQAVNGVDIFSIQKLQKISKPSLNDESPDVLNAERILKMIGYDIDQPDMVLDEKTFKAIEKFQRDSGLFPYGVLDFTTQQALNDIFGRLAAVIDTQYERAAEILNK